MNLPRVMPLVLLACVADAAAHHSRNAFDLDASITVEGNVTEVGWTNPSLLPANRRSRYRSHLDVRRPLRAWPCQERLVENDFDGGIPGTGSSPTPTRIRTRGLRFSTTLHALTERPSTRSGRRTRSESGNARRSLRRRTSRVPGRSFARLRENQIGGFGTPDAWSLTQAGEDAVARFDINDDPVLRCAPRGMPRMLEYPYAQHWENAGDGIAITIEHSTATRRLNGPTDDPVLTQPEMGRSTITHRDAERLVVASTGFHPLEWGLWRGIDSSADKRIVEEYRLTDDGYRFELTYTIEDPEYLAAPASRTLRFRKLHDFEFAEEPPCDVETATRHLRFEGQD